MIFLALFGWLFLFTQQLQFVLGYSALQAGVRCLPFALTMGVVSPGRPSWLPGSAPRWSSQPVWR